MLFIAPTTSTSVVQTGWKSLMKPIVSGSVVPQTRDPSQVVPLDQPSLSGCTLKQVTKLGSEHCGHSLMIKKEQQQQRPQWQRQQQQQQEQQQHQQQQLWTQSTASARILNPPAGAVSAPSCATGRRLMICANLVLCNLT